MRSVIALVIVATAVGIQTAQAQASPPSTPAPEAKAPAAVRAAAEDVDALAQGWFSGGGGEEAARELLRRVGGRTRLLVHLPSGRVAAPAPASLSERDNYQLAVVVDQGMKETWHVDVHVITCSARDPFRIKGDLASGLQPQSFQETGGHNWALLPVEQPLSCGADRMVYTIGVSIGDDKPEPVQASWRIRPVYHLAATFATGFDWSKTNAYPVVQEEIKATSDTRGLVADIGFTWFPTGVDYEDMRWWNHWLNPFVLFKADAITEGFKVGTAITPAGGISVGIGLSVNKVAVLDGVAVGSALPNGDPPTRMVWSREGLGLYIGILFDQNLFKALKSMVGAAGKAGG